MYGLFHRTSVLRHQLNVLFLTIAHFVAISAGLRAQTDQEKADWLKPVLDSQALVVAYLKPAELDIPRLGVRLRSLFPSARTTITNWLSYADQIERDFQISQVDELAIVMSTHSGPGYSPLFCVPFSGKLTHTQTKGLLPLRFHEKYKIRRLGEAWIAGPEAALERISASIDHRNEEDDLAQQHYLSAIDTNSAAALQIVARLSSDHKRAMGARHINMPDWLGSGSMAEEIAPVQWIRIDLKSRDQTTVTIVLQATNRNVVDALKVTAIDRLRNVLLSVGASDEALRALPAGIYSVEDSQVAFELATNTELFASFYTGVVPQLDEKLKQVVKAQALRQLRSIGLQILNHNSAYKKLPPAGGIKKTDFFTGSLSWRVHILPFLGDEENKLFNRFRLKEDWDSEHNKQLIPLMPEVFLIPNSSLRPEQGLSNFCVPTGEKTAWPMDRIIEYGDLTDGPANTISVLEARDEHAQIWTKPEPFEVDPKDLGSKLGGHFRSQFLMSTADGAMAFRPLTFDPKQFERMLTRSAGD